MHLTDIYTCAEARPSRRLWAFPASRGSRVFCPSVPCQLYADSASHTGVWRFTGGSVRWAHPLPRGGVRLDPAGGRGRRRWWCRIGGLRALHRAAPGFPPWVEEGLGTASRVWPPKAPTRRATG